jgi:segregation and condensation protein B
VIEAALFVGGGPLTARKISGLLRGSYGPKEVELVIDELNDAYVAQARPYEIRLGDGGYRLELRPEYDRLRNRVYGSGPRAVRLSQEVLEVLALVAYRQPISAAEIEELGKQNAANLLRQLLRRDLIAFARGPSGRKDVRYHTTPRFLSVFGLGTIADLPQAEDLARK